MTGNKEDSLYAVCKQAFVITNEGGKLKDVAVNMDDAARLVLKMTSVDEFGKEWVFERIVKIYLSIIANELGFRSGRYGKGVYFSKYIDHEKISEALVDNIREKADRLRASADEMAEIHEKKFSKDSDISGQMAIENIDMSMYEEMTMDDVIDFILGKAVNE